MDSAIFQNPLNPVKSLTVAIKVILKSCEIVHCGYTFKVCWFKILLNIRAGGWSGETVNNGSEIMQMRNSVHMKAGLVQKKKNTLTVA